MTEITDKICIGDSKDAGDVHALHLAEVTAILNCAVDLRNRFTWPDFTVAHCGLIDGPGNRWSHYVSAVQQLTALIEDGHKVLVHCHAGQSRSVSIVMMYLNGQDPQGWDYWREYIHQRRGLMDGNPHPAHREMYEAHALPPTQEIQLDVVY